MLHSDTNNRCIKQIGTMEEEQVLSKVDKKGCFSPRGAVILFALIFALQIAIYAKINGTAGIINYLKNAASGTPGIPRLPPYKKFEAKPNNTANDKLIIYWNSFFGLIDWAQGYGHKPFKNCKVKNCIATSDKHKFKDSDAMLCHMRSGGCGINELPKERKPNQYWIYNLMESQENSAHDQGLVPYNGVFNLTMTFKLDSDILASYNSQNTVIDNLNNKNFVFQKGTKSSVAWVVSNCVTSTAIRGRMAYVAHLEKYITIKRFGRCPGHVPCGVNCFTDIAKENKFYFAAENSLCKDYITEKPWNALKVGMIPIVYGLGDYSKVLPPHSYIDVRNFKSPQLLANYLNRVASNETLYNSYFKWRESYKHLQKIQSSFCELCAFLNQPNPPRRIINHLDQFWSYTNDCVTPETFNRHIIAQ